MVECSRCKRNLYPRMNGDLPRHKNPETEDWCSGSGPPIEMTVNAPTSERQVQRSRSETPMPTKAAETPATPVQGEAERKTEKTKYDPGIFDL